MQFRVVVLSPPGWEHARIFAEIADTLVLGLQAIGQRASASVNGFQPNALNIVLAGFSLTPEDFPHLPPRVVLYNLEQLGDEIFEKLPGLPALLRHFEVWDFSERNIEKLIGVAPRLFHLPIGTVPQMTRIKSAPVQDIDVLFYGVMTERRKAALAAIEAAGLRVHYGFGLYGAARDALIARSKVVLNLHGSSVRIFEIVRVSYLLANRKAVVSEVSDDTEIPPDLIDAVRGVPYERLTEACRELVADDAARRALEIRGFERMSARKESVYLRKLLNQRAKVIGRE
jgi:hypothetical protein